MLAVLPEEATLPAVGLAIIVYVVVALYVLWRRQPLELRVLAVGLLTAALALWSGQFVAVGGFQSRGPQGALSIGGNEAAATLGRVAVLLILGGLGMAMLTRWGSPAAAPRPEETRHDNVV